MSVFKRATFAANAALVLGLGAGLLPAQAASVFVTADITASETWTETNEYILTKVIYVTNGATLTIEPGVVVRGEPEAAAGTNDPGTLVITRGSKILALGTKNKPIVFTNLDDDNIGTNPGTFPYDTAADALSVTGTWGGVILLGRGYVANNSLAGPNGAREIQIEGLNAAGGLGLYGNCAATALFPDDCDDDDSGVFHYVSIRYGGFNLSANNEINGLTLGGVGRSTEIHHVEVFQNKDDGMEIFGGAVGVKNVMMFSGGDDGLDYDEGWRGKAQFVFVVQGTPGADKSDKGGEHDGGNNPDGSQPRAIPTVYNATYVGLGQKAYTGKNLNTALHLRDNAGGRYYNSLIADFGGAAMLVEGTATSCKGAISSGERYEAAYSPANPHYLAPNSDFELEFQDNCFWCMGQTDQIPGGRCSVTTTTTCCANADCPGGQTCVDQAPTYGGDTGKIHRGYDQIDLFSNGALDNDYLACNTALPIRALVRTPSGNAATPDPVAIIDPRPAIGALTTDRSAPEDGFFEPAGYKGAFGGENWADGWTNVSRLGYFPPRPQVNVVADIAANTTWIPDNEYVLTKVIYVTNGATLTILPGTVVRGEPEAAAGTNDPGTLVITRGSKINAQGTPDKPIVFTNLDDSNVHGHAGQFPYDTAADALSVTGTWGGVILLGRGYVANNSLAGPNGAREIQIEGLNAAGGLGLYGNCAATALFPDDCDDDDSGVFHYVSIRYGGFNLSANNEINGLTLGGVGRSTEIHHVEVFQNKDDGMEIFGGAVGVKNVMMFSGGDDGLDYDEGWRGKAQFVFVVQGTPGADKSDKGGEHDGGNNPDGSQPRAIPTVYNATYVGLGQKAYTGKNLNTALHLRDNAGGRYYNSLIADFGGAAMLVEGTATSCKGAISSGERYEAAYSPANPHYLAPNSDFELEFQDNCFWCMGQTDQIPGGRCSVTTTTTCCANADCPGGQTCVDQAPTYGGDTGKIHRGYDQIDLFSNGALDNDYLACNTALPIRALVRTPSGNAATPDPVAIIDPRPKTGALGTDRSVPADGFFVPAPYKGAFGDDNWAGCWTNTSLLGYLATCDTATGAGAPPDEVGGFGFNHTGAPAKERLSWTAPALPGCCGVQFFDVLRTDGSDSSAANAFNTATCLETDDTDAFVVDADVPVTGNAFFYLVRAGNPCGEGSLGRRSDGTARVGTSCP